MDISWKREISARFRATQPNLWGQRAFPQSFHTRKLDEISVFYSVHDLTKWLLPKRLVHDILLFGKFFFSNTKNSFTRKKFVFTEGKAASLVNILPLVKVVYSRIFFSDIWLLSLKVFFMGFYCSLDIRLPRIPKGLGTIWLGISTRLKFFFF